MTTALKQVFLDDPILFVLGVVILCFGSVVGVITGHVDEVIIMWLLIASVGIMLRNL